MRPPPPPAGDGWAAPPPPPGRGPAPEGLPCRSPQVEEGPGAQRGARPHRVSPRSGCRRRPRGHRPGGAVTADLARRSAPAGAPPPPARAPSPRPRPTGSRSGSRSGWPGSDGGGGRAQRAPRGGRARGAGRGGRGPGGGAARRRAIADPVRAPRRKLRTIPGPAEPPNTSGRATVSEEQGLAPRCLETEPRGASLSLRGAEGQALQEQPCPFRAGGRASTGLDPCPAGMPPVTGPSACPGPSILGCHPSSRAIWGLPAPWTVPPPTPAQGGS
ncbi:basic salivary proline-rich protein 2-like [Dama dama]|uniref:basic salivary proline-rich protein 2-like n=1 Tax=Dama dama TaxID=30532 RepID=UPI002A365E06|nr:basic salivary proline-rich protein 2-like [Dama dama]